MNVSIVVPIWNEAENIPFLVQRIHQALTDKKYLYEIIFVDDHSSDKSAATVKKLAKEYPIQYFLKKGKKGKAFSLTEGFSYAQGDTFVMIDADLQYHPEAIPNMVEKIQKGADIVVANRIRQNISPLRRRISYGFKKIFGDMLFGLNHDIQAGLKAFTRASYEQVAYTPSSGWAFDLEFLHRAKRFGFQIENVDIVFEKRLYGKSKISLLPAVVQIGGQAIRTKLKNIEPLHFAPTRIESMQGAGVKYNKQSYVTHTTLHHSQSAIQTITGSQRTLLLLVIAICMLYLLFQPLLAIQIFVGVLSAIYFLDVLFNFFLVMKSLHFPQEITSTEKEIDTLQNKDLPIYTILCPLYKEAHVIPQFLHAIHSLDWPKAKLDVLLLFEEDDKESIDTVAKIKLPSFVRSIIVPHSMPKTKPKACNYGLSQAKGEYLVIYDAEDMPDPLQLKKAFLSFQKVDPKVICLQAKLNYYNPHQNLLTRFFTAEYSLWFDVTLTGLQAANTSIPLGGTSNHFRTKDLKQLEGWDPFNVTEDADLGGYGFLRKALRRLLLTLSL